ETGIDRRPAPGCRRAASPSKCPHHTERRNTQAAAHDMTNPIETVLFDLDGTLLDTAPDLARALNATLLANGRQALPLDVIRPAVSHGGNALIELGFDLRPGAAGIEPLRQTLLEHYRTDIARHTRLFPGMDRVLAHIES